MDIAYWGEPGALLIERLRDRPYFDKLYFSDASAGKLSRCDLYLCGQNPRFPRCTLKTQLCILPGTQSCLPPFVFAKAAVSCGMCAHDSVSFSSIGECSALLCLTRAVPFRQRLFEPAEIRVPFSHRLGIYHNLALSFCIVFLDFFFLKERNTREAVSDQRPKKRDFALLQ